VVAALVFYIEHKKMIPSK